MFSLQRVSMSFTANAGETLTALENIDLEIESGEFVSIVGPSGCGKTTFLNLLGGFTKPTAGAVLKNNRVIKAPGPDRTMMFQDYALFPWLTVRENIAFGLAAKGQTAAERSARADHFIALVGLTGFADAYPAQLSGGMRQRVSIARALAPEPDAVLMDEPFAALDSLTRDKLQEELLTIWSRRRTTLVLITHNIDEAIYLSDRVVVMSKRPGRIRAILPVPLPRPRDAKIRIRHPVFLDLKQNVSELLGNYQTTANIEVAL